MKFSLWLTLLLLTLINLPVLAQTAQFDNKSISGIHNARYCEVIVIKQHFYKMEASVYNSLNLDTCPSDLWNKLNVATIKKQFDASAVRLNGPRYFVMDSLIAKGETIAAPITTIGGIRFQKRAEIATDLWDGPLGSKLYAPNKVQRNTVWIYNPGTMIYKLISPAGDVYVMQSYAQIVNPNLKLTDLPNLAAHLKLPKGWKYQTEILTKSLELKANGIAYVLQDDLYNSYQKE